MLLEEKAPKLSSFQSTLIALKPRLSTDRSFSFLENVNLVPDIGPWPQKDEKCDKKFELSASVDTLFCRVYYRRPLLGSWLTCQAARSKSPDRKGQGKNIPIQTKFTGVPRELFRFTREGRGKHGSLNRGPEKVRKQHSDVSL